MEEILSCICQSQKNSEEINQERYKETPPNENIIFYHDKNKNLSSEKAFLIKKNEEKKIIFNIYIYQVIIIKTIYQKKKKEKMIF